VSDASSGDASSASRAIAIPAHSHCEICHKAIKQRDRFCGSAECEQKHQQNIAEKKKAMWKMIAIMMGLILVFTVLNRTDWLV